MATEQDRDFLKQFAGFKPPQSVAELRAALDAFAAILNDDPCGSSLRRFSLPVAHAPGVDVDEIRMRVIADSATAQRHSDVA